MIFLNESDILQLADPANLIDEMERAFSGPSEFPERLHFHLPGSDSAQLLLMPAWRARNYIGVKVATVMPGNGGLGRPTVDGLFVLLRGETGEPLAVLSASALTLVRTAAVSGLAARHLAPGDARTLLMVGTGALAPHLIRSHMTVRALERILVWGRNIDKAKAVAAQFGAAGPSVSAIENLEEGVRSADVISVATASTAPLIAGGLVNAGSHVDLVGSFRPEMRECDSDLLSRARLVVDTPASFAESGDLIMPISEGVLDVSKTSTLSQLVGGRPSSRTSRDITVFKAVGTGLADLAAAIYLFSLASSPARSKPQKSGKHNRKVEK